MTNSEFEDLVFKHSLFNASQHSGKANLGSIINKIIAEKPELKSDIKNLMLEIKPIVEKINSMSLDEQLKLLQKDFPDMKSETKILYIQTNNKIIMIAKKVEKQSLKYKSQLSKCQKVLSTNKYIIF